MGLINDKDASKKGNARLSRHLFIKAESIQPYYTEKKGLSKFGDMHEMYRKDDRNIFDPPLILFKEGTKNDSVCSAFIDYKCAYLSAVLGIKLKNKNAAFHKALVACYNSAIGNYYFFLTGSSWETNKGGQIQRNEAKNFPAFPYSLDMGVINELANKVDAIIKIKKENGNDEPDESVVLIQKQIDEILYRELNITSNERSTIEDVLKYSIALKNRYLNSKAEKYIENLNAYSNAFTKAVNSLLKYSNKTVWLKSPDSQSHKTPLRVVVIHFDGKKQSISTEKIDSILDEINKYIYEKHSESIYYRKVIKYYKNDCIYIIKPNQRRFWSVSQALNDADELLLDFMKQ